MIREEGGARREVVDRITDVFARDGAEFLTTPSTGAVRLDRIESVEAT